MKTPHRRIVRTAEGWGLDDGRTTLALVHPLADMLAGAPLTTTNTQLGGDLLAPVDLQDIWAAGVTYERSLDARTDESSAAGVYDRVYNAERPELFLKSTAGRVVGPGGVGNIRSDSTWDVPEPELGLVVNAEGGIFGYTIGDDISSRTIEGENPLYLPQAKIYDGSCVLGPWIVPAGSVGPPFDIRLTIQRGGMKVFDGATSTSAMRRSFEELIGWLFENLSFPNGAVLLTGTGLVPPDEVTLMAGDHITIEIYGLGRLTHSIDRLRPAGLISGIEARGTDGTDE